MSSQVDRPDGGGDRDFYKEYTWIQLLAKGGMGFVYLAEDKRNGKRCVIKQMSRPENATPEEISESKRFFEREAALLKSLDHPGIVKFSDFYVSTKDDRFFLVMDYVSGHSLETILQNYGRFSQEDALKVGIQICEVLEHLHFREEPIIYRDLKPSNLMLTIPEGQVVFIDFGIARVLMPQDAATRVVTAGYSPPEQYFGRPEIRSDLYALGATLAHLVTGVRPKPLITSVPSQHCSDILPDLDELIVELTAHSTQDRPASARIVRHRLYRIYQQLHPDFEIPEELFSSTKESHEDQFISQRIMQSGLRAAESSAAESWESARGPELESYSDDNLPSALHKLTGGLQQRLSSTRVPRVSVDSEGRTLSDSQSLPAAKRLRDTFDRHQGDESPDTFWQRIVKWVKRD